MSPSDRTPPATPAETPAVAQTPEGVTPIGSSGRGSVDSPTHDAEWHEQNRLVLIEARDGAYRREGEALERMHLYDAYARVLAEMVLRAGVKPTSDNERAAIEWAEQRPDVRKPKSAQMEIAA